MVQKKFPALGRGLDALLKPDEVKTDGTSSISEISIPLIQPNPSQPRRDFDETAMAELAASIAEIGIVQPVTLRAMDDGTYQIIAGERRWRAAQQAGLTKIPAYIRSASDDSVMEMALVENIQREDLNPIEVALAYQRLIETSKQTQEQLAKRLGKNRSTITNSLRLLKLPAAIQVALQNREIDMGHARALLPLEQPSLQLKIFEETRKNNLSVRAVEQKVKTLLDRDGIQLQGALQRAKPGKLPKEYAMLSDHLTRFFKTRVQLTCNEKGRGKITIPFANEEELERIAEILDKLKD
ncbi:MAG: ParB/RepB/Spo0J family partition protein [Bacteroidaceae bacterium]|nr:ParB/RepB/Spo0J family partition protein [Bacteroidaceae bacterium]